MVILEYFSFINRITITKTLREYVAVYQTPQLQQPERHGGEGSACVVSGRYGGLNASYIAQIHSKANSLVEMIASNNLNNQSMCFCISIDHSTQGRQNREVGSSAQFTVLLFQTSIASQAIQTFFARVIYLYLRQSHQIQAKTSTNIHEKPYFVKILWDCCK